MIIIGHRPMYNIDFCTHRSSGFLYRLHKVLILRSTESKYLQFILILLNYIDSTENDACYCYNYVWSSFESMYSSSKKKQNTPIYFNTNYLTEMKLVPIIMDYCLLSFDALKFFLEVRLHRASLPNFNFFIENPQIFQRNRKVHLPNCLETNFHNISNISLRIIRRRNYS